MRILTALTYYRPHYSGLTVYAERLARTLAARGHQVTILTSRYHPSLPSREVLDGVQVVRVTVAARVSKGVLMPSLPALATRLLAAQDIVHLHLPQFDAGYLALLARLFGRPVVVTYHCDLRLPRSPVHRLAGLVSRATDRISTGLADVVVANTREYAEESRLLRRHLGKLAAIAPPIQLLATIPGAEEDLRQRLGLEGEDRVIGMVARLATEKGAEVLALALPKILEHHPRARVLYVGQFQGVLGEEAYARRLQLILDRLGDHWKFLGILADADMPAFYGLCDVTVLPSLNSTESFGMVQVESMVCGTPVVASDLPGVRRVVAETGMGLSVPPGDPAALAEGVRQILESPERFRKDPAEIQRRFSAERAAVEYENLFQTLLQQGARAT
jgi:glycosyltransferase involved in cell wall biosynthesis